MRHFSKSIEALVCAAVALLLCGCSGANTFLMDQIVKRSEIQSDEAWLKYESLNQAGQLDNDGYYYGQTETGGNSVEGVMPAGTIHITFAQNAYLNVTYSYDAEKTKLILAPECYLNPGDSLYLASVEVNNPYSNQYGASAFRIYAYDKNGKRELFSTNAIDAETVLTIPSDFAGTELSIEPIGEYKNRTLFLSDYYLKSDETQGELNGVWSMDIAGEKPTETVDNTMEISPVVSYSVRYSYENYINEYYFENSSPRCIYARDGIVQFEQASSQDSTDHYTVQLHRYITASLTNQVSGFLPFTTNGNVIQEIQINGKEWEDLDKDKKEQTIPHLKCGDKLVLRVGAEYVVSCEETETQVVELENSQEYTIIVPQTSKTELHVAINKG